jgi:hypothetical protein
MKMGSVDLIVCQESSGSIPYCQVGRDEQMRLSVGLMNSEVSWDQQVQLTGEEDRRNLLMIGGIGVFLPFSQEEAEIYVASATMAEEQSDVTVREEEQSAMTVREEEELEQTLEAAQADDEDDDHSEEWLSIFSQEAKENATWEFAAEEEEAYNIFFANLWEQIEALEERVKVQGMHIQQEKLKIDEEGMGDYSDLPMSQKILQLGRLHEQSQPLE